MEFTSKHGLIDLVAKDVAEHDMGLAMGNFSYEATKRGLHVHQMAGIEPAKARQTLS